MKKLYAGELPRFSLPCLELVLVLSLALHVGHATALKLASGDDFNIDLDTTLNYNAQWRIEDAEDSQLRRPDPDWSFTELFDHLSDPNTVIAQNMDDGNNSFNTGLVSNRVSILSDLEASYRDYGLFLRAKAFYDHVYEDDDHDLSETGYLTYNNRPNTSRGNFPDDTRDRHGKDIDILDAFVFADIPIGERLLNLRIGRQVINWGESLFNPGVNGLQNRADATVVTIPGIEIKEILLPTGAVYGQLDLTPDMALEAYVQYEWKRTRLNGVGSYFSTQDYLGPSAEYYYAGALELFGFDPFVARTRNDTPGNDGQWGIALRRFLESGTEFAVYAVRAHDKKPSFILNSTEIAGFLRPDSYTVRFFDDIESYAASVSTLAGNWQLGGEISWTDGTPMASSLAENGVPVRDELLQLQASFTRVVSPTAFWDDLSVVGELVVVSNESRDSDELAYDDQAMSYSLRAEFSYRNVWEGIDLSVPVFFRHDFDGTIKEANITDSSRSLSISIKATYLEKLTGEFSYAYYDGGGIDNWVLDRDNVALSIQYSF